MITIIDYKSGNLKSISNGFKKIGQDFQITDDIEEIANAKHLVLPGVGAFGSAMENLEKFREKKEDAFMIRMFQARNLMMYFSIILTLAIIISLML